MKNIISSLIIALGIIGLGLCIKCGLNSFTAQNRFVQVRGLCEKEVMANKVTWPIVYRIAGNDLPELYNQIENTNKIIIKYLTANNIPATDITVGAPNVTDNATDRYSSNNYLYRYNITQNVVVTSNQVELVGKLINQQGELLKKGISIVTDDWSNQILYEYTNLNEIKPEMIAEATSKAREAAEKFATDSNSKLGKIKTAQQGQFSISDRDPYTPFIKNIRIVTYVDYYIED